MGQDLGAMQVRLSKVGTFKWLVQCQVDIMSKHPKMRPFGTFDKTIS